MYEIIDDSLPEPFFSFLKSIDKLAKPTKKQSDCFKITSCTVKNEFLSVQLNFSNQAQKVSFKMGSNFLEIISPSRPSVRTLEDLERTILAVYDFHSQHMKDLENAKKLWSDMSSLLDSDNIMSIASPFPINFAQRKEIFGIFAKEPYFSIIILLFQSQLKNREIYISQFKDLLDEPQSTISRKLDDLEARNSIIKFICDKDRRVVKVRLSLSEFLKCLKYLTIVSNQTQLNCAI